jgi:hypothetical protein
MEHGLRRRPRLPQRQRTDLRDGQAIRVTDYWGEPFEAPTWRESLADELEMPPDGVWPAVESLQSDEDAPGGA